MNNVRAFVHPSGLKIMATHVPSSESCAISIMIRVGSIYENDSIRGGAHLIEHVMFQGTQQLPSQAILSRTLDSMGAVYNAYTTYNMTSYHIKVQKAYLSKTVDILCQMVSDSLFKSDKVNNEKKVVVEELRKLRDEPSSYVSELFYSIVFKHSPFELSIGGTEKSVKDTDPEKLRRFWKERYILPNMLISVAGNVDLEELKQSLQSSPLFTQTLQKGVIDVYNKPLPLQKQPRLKIQHRENMKQVQVQVGFPTFGIDHPDRFALRLARIILGGNMSSRIFTSLRDYYGLAYSPHSQVNFFETMGEFSIASGVDGEAIFTGNLDKKKGKADPLAVIFQEFFRLCQSEVPEDELHKAKEYVKGNILLEMEDNQRIAEYYGRLFLLDRPVFTMERYIEEITRVTSDDILRVCRDIIVPNRINLALIGNIQESDAQSYLDKTSRRWNRILQVETRGGAPAEDSYYYPELFTLNSNTNFFSVNGF